MSENSLPQNESQTDVRYSISAERGIARSEFAIGVLSVTAVVLFVSLLLVQSTPRAALGNGMASYGGNYAMGVGTLSIADEDVLYVIDNTTQKMIAYRYDGNRNQITVMQGIDLGALRGNHAAAPAAGNANPANTGNAPSSNPRNQRPTAPKSKSAPAPAPQQPPTQPTP